MIIVIIHRCIVFNIFFSIITIITKKKFICQRNAHNDFIKNVQFSFRLKPIYFVHFILMNDTTDKANKIFDILLFERK